MPATIVRDEITVGITDRIRAELRRQNLTQIQFAELLGVGQWWISRRLNGDISVRDLIRFADALNVPVTRFLPTSAARRKAAA
ncbi:MAG: helix-turn-helix transcriptional regulator [Chloroflexota bacterium]